MQIWDYQLFYEAAATVIGVNIARKNRLKSYLNSYTSFTCMHLIRQPMTDHKTTKYKMITSGIAQLVHESDMKPQNASKIKFYMCM